MKISYLLLIKYNLLLIFISYYCCYISYCCYNYNSSTCPLFEIFIVVLLERFIKYNYINKFIQFINLSFMTVIRKCFSSFIFKRFLSRYYVSVN